MSNPAGKPKRKLAPPQPRMGRPRRTDEETITLGLRLTRSERERWRKFALEQSIKLNQMVRESVETAIARGSTR